MTDSRKGNRSMNDSTDSTPGAATSDFIDRIKADDAKRAANQRVIAHPQRPRSVTNSGALDKWLDQAFHGVIEDVRSTPEGNRNGRLRWGARRLAEISHGGLDETRCKRELERAAQDSGIWAEDGERACRASIESGWNKGISDPKDLADIEAGGKKVGKAQTNGAPSEFDPSWEARIKSRVEQLRLETEARRAFKAEQRQTVSPPITLTTFLAQPDNEPQYRIDRLLPTGGRAMLAAQYKAGKTTLRDNLIRALVDGKPFLGEFKIERPATVALIDDEVDERQLRRWLRSQMIANTDRVIVKCLRGEVSAFDILDTDVRAWWAEQFHGIDILLIDCLRPIFDALGLSEDKDGGQFLVALDALLKEAGISETVVTHHFGHYSERSRGDSRLLDWPDVTWRIMRDKNAEDLDNPAVDRYFSAYGRDVDVHEGLLDYTPETRSLMYLPNRTRGNTKVDALAPHLITLLKNEPGMTRADIEKSTLKLIASRQIIRDTIRQTIRDRDIYTQEEEGKSHAIRHYINPSHGT
jgi:hypothetical protein